jgi:choline dehydrogenase
VQNWQLTTWPGQSGQSDNVATFVTDLIAPLSRGSVSIRRKDVRDTPIVNAGWLTYPIDVELAINDVRRMQQLVSTKAIPPVLEASLDSGSILTNHNLEGSEVLKSIQQQLSTFYHAAGTCKMGRRGDDTAVVERKAKVFGKKNLRIVDLPGVPSLPPGQQQARREDH